MFVSIPTQSISTSIDGDSIDLQGAVNFSFQFVWTGTPTGSVKLQFSINNNNWSDIPGSSQEILGAAGSHGINYQQAGFRFVRAVYTHTSGSGAIFAMAYIKQPNTIKGEQ